MTKKGQKMVIGNRQHILKFAAHSVLLYVYIYIYNYIYKYMHIVYICIYILFGGGGGWGEEGVDEKNITGQQQYPCFFT